MKPKHKELKDNRFVEKPLDFANLYKSAAETNVNLIELNKKKKIKATGSPNMDVKDSKDVKIDKNNDSSFENKTGFKNNHALTIGNNKLKKKLKDFSLPSDTNLQAEDMIDELKSSSSIKKKSKNKHIPIAIDNNTDHPINLKKVEKKSRPKKRNKSVSLMLDDNEIAIKKPKGNEILSTSETLIKPRNSKRKTTHNECKIGNNVDDAENKGNKQKADKETIVNIENDKTIIRKKSSKKSKKHETGVSGDNETVESKQTKKITHQSQLNEDSNKTDGEPVTKSLKKNYKPELIADLETSNIGVNTNTLTNILNEMSVVDQRKKETNKEDKKTKTETTRTKFETSLDKQKFNKRKWNKDKKEKCDDRRSTPVIIENLPINIIFTYKKLLRKYFTKFGPVKKVGIAQVYPTEDPKPVFATAVYFLGEDSAKKALQEDNSYFEGNMIRVKESLPDTQTTAVVHSYSEVNDQIISSIFSEAGRIRQIRQTVNGQNKYIAFVEFDGPEEVERAIQIAKQTKIGGKNVYVSKYRLKTDKNGYRT